MTMKKAVKKVAKKVVVKKAAPKKAIVQKVAPKKATYEQVPSYAGSKESYVEDVNCRGIRVRPLGDSGLIRLHVSTDFARVRPHAQVPYVAMDIPKAVLVTLLNAL
jgi:hypothetical protein